MTEATSIKLDQDQRRAALAAPDERLYVVAGPGSGKTEVVSARIGHLAEAELSGDSLLVISFSRAAVEAVQRRMRENSPHTAAGVTTLDSLASRLLTDAGVDVAGMSFDERIRRTTRALNDDPGFVDQLSMIEHLIVDEIQDVVGLRADLLIKLLGSLPSSTGFTLLGDPLQGIYDFQLVPGTLTADDVRAKAVELGAEVVQLHGQYRAQTPDAHRAMATRGDGRVVPWTHTMEDHVSGMPRLGADELADWINGAIGTLAVLTQSNAQALVVARQLHAAGLEAELLGPAQDRPVAPWIALHLGDAPSQLDREAFAERMTDVDDEGAQERWLRLRSLTRPTGRSIDVGKVASRLAAGIIPVGLRAERHRVTISTIHRAKGLEFDRVLLLDPAEWYPKDDHDAYARALYVAITRPRHRLFTFSPPGNARMWRHDQRSQRTVRVPYGKKGISGFEVRGSDWRTPFPPDLEGNPARAQQLLAEVLADPRPRPVDIRFNAYESTSSRPTWDAYLGDQRIGTLGPDFQQDFVARTKRSDRWPDLQGLYLTGVETVAGQKQSGPVGQNGLWLNPLITGPASLNWSH